MKSKVVSVVTSINFNAQFINQVTIKRYNPDKNNYNSIPVSFVQIEAENNNDIQAVKKTTKDWQNGMFSDKICIAAERIAEEKTNNSPVRIYALTSQMKDFDNLRPDNILGLVETENNKNALEINHLQVNPEFLPSIEPPKYRHVGSGILDSLKNLYNKVIELTSVYTATNFYEKNGFEIFDIHKFRYRWIPKK